MLKKTNLKKHLIKVLIKFLFFISPFRSFKFYQNLKKGKLFTKNTPEKNKNHQVGIIIEPNGFHRFYIEACLEMNVSFTLIDILASDWFEKIKNCGCDGFLGWPSASLTIWKTLYDERIYVVEKDLGKFVFPTFNETWVWESKRRMHYWLEANKIKHPKGWVFYDFAEAMTFIDKANFPLVFKTNHGDSSRGVRIIRSKKQAGRMIKKSFGKGINFSTSYPMDKEWGNVFFQEYIKDHIEWRLIRVGDSYFGYQKVKKGGFASGHGDAIYTEVPIELLDLTRKITDKHNFRSMSFDVLETEKGEHLIIELQSLFGDTKSGKKCMVNGRPGRYIYDYEKKSWRFEEGIFDQNNCCNLRINWLLKSINQKDKPSCQE